jgi:Flp pilus assembly protein TadD
VSRGGALSAQRKPEAAESSYREALRVAPDDPYVLHNVGYFLVEQDKNLAEALQLIRRAVDAQPTNPYFLDGLGWAYFKLGHLDEAERYIGESVRLDGTSLLPQEHLGDVYSRQGKVQQARAAWGKALSLSVTAESTARLKGKLDGLAKE